ncbi:myoD family inhibitor domain-containing protein-like isoform X2 [Xenopus laevis]|uniref:MyoD family inhibitor domain-containing protein-like isoform X2 n=1 Tax=Xenopus laevis TaxID=8355 RepID=A0A8J0TFM5_XENLA|nr:myoD family inhibitor domain-containing protein-like isoform X2 [Xenopus laevis]
MSEGHSGSFDASLRTPLQLPAGNNPTLEPPEMDQDTDRLENDPPLSPEPSCSKHKNRGSSRRKKGQERKLSASHIEQAAGDDSCALCLLAGLFCEASILCSALLACVSCGLCSDRSPCCSASPDGLGCTSVGNGSCDCDCVTASEGCRSSDCLDLCLECCALCFPS